MNNKQILIVEDTTAIADLVEMLLCAEGYQVAGKVVSGEEALAHLPRSTPDLVLMDINLEGEVDGIETATYISNFFGIPVIFMTGIVDDGVIAQARIAGPYGYQQKPFKKDELMANIKMALMTHALQTRVRDTTLTAVSGKNLLAYAEADDAVIASGIDGKIIYINRRTEEMTGWTNDELVAQPLATLLRQDTPCETGTTTPSPEFSGGDKEHGPSMENDMNPVFCTLMDGSFGQHTKTVYIRSRNGEQKQFSSHIICKTAVTTDTIGAIITLRPYEGIECAAGRNAGTILLGQES